MVAQLLDKDGDIDRGVEAGGRVEGLLEEDIDIPGLAGDGVGAGLVGCQFTVVAGQVVEQRPHLAQGRHLVLDHEIGHPALAMHTGAAQLVRGHILTQHGFDHAGTGQAEEGLVGLDQEAALPRQVGATTGVETEHAHDAGHDATDFAQRRKGLRIAVQAAHAGGDIGAGAVVDPHHRDPLARRKFEQASQFLAIGRVHGTGAHGEVMAVQGHIAPVHLDDCRDQRGAVQVGAPVLVQHRRLTVGEKANALPDCHAVFLVLALDILDAGRLVGTLLQLPACLQGFLVGTGGGGDLPRYGKGLLIPLGERIFESRDDPCRALCIHIIRPIFR